MQNTDPSRCGVTREDVGALVGGSSPGINIIIARSVPIMEINSTPKQFQNHFQGYHIDLLLPFSLRSVHSRKGQQYERDGHWNQKQRLKYSVFLQFFQPIISDPLKKKRVRIYDMMSDMIVTRNSNQCRSHHQKMEKYRNSVPEIVASVAEKYEPSVYRELSQRYQALLKNLLENADKYIRSPTETGEKGAGKGKAGSGKGKIEREGSPEAEGEDKQKQGKVEVEVEPLPMIKTEALQVEEFLVDKKELKKTNDEYQQPALPDQEDELPMMGLDPFSDDPNDDQQPLPNLRDQPYPENPHAFHPTRLSFPRSNFGQSGNYQLLDDRSRFYYEQQIAALQAQRQWHVSTAEQLYSQWNNQLQNIKYCDQGLKMYNQLLAGNRGGSNQHRMGL